MLYYKIYKLLTLPAFYFVAQELEAIRDALIPSLACAAANIGDIDAFKAIGGKVTLTFFKEAILKYQIQTALIGALESD